MAALPKELQEKFNVLIADEAADPLKNSKPNIFDSEAWDTHANRDVAIGYSDDHDAAVRRGVNPPGKNKQGEPTRLPTQMTHAWIAYVLPKENLTTQGKRLSSSIKNSKGIAYKSQCNPPLSTLDFLSSDWPPTE